MLELAGKKPLTAPEQLLFWIKEREHVRIRKEAGIPKPWSDDPTFARTYFCNVRREDDRVTRWIRQQYSPHVSERRWFLYNIVLSRLINWPETLGYLGYLTEHNPEKLEERLAERAKRHGKVWGGAYIITTHGLPMGKAAYLAWNVLGATYKAGDWLTSACGYAGSPSCGAAHKALQTIEGLGSFLAAQVVADLKNTPDHPLQKADDWATFVAHGPGSLRGLQWFWGDTATITPSNFLTYFTAMREYVDDNWDYRTMGNPICNQDLQNCLCEYDKYMRVSTGTGRSKRNYAGT